MSVRPPSPPGLNLPPALEVMRDDLARLEARLRDGRDVRWPAQQRLLDWVFASGGKRIRPAVILGVARLGSADSERVLTLAAAVETLHAATLVHDDLVDGSLVRRGFPTLNTRWGAGATVLAGDWLFARAARFAAATANVRVLDVFSRTLATMSEGELGQLFGRSGVPTREEYEYRIYAKTAALFEAAGEAAAILSVPREEHVQALARYGRELGMAFQIVDDMLDFTGDSGRLGKPVGSDLRVGTVTLPVLLFLRHRPDAAAWLDGEGPDADQRLEKLIAAVRDDVDAIAASRAEADRRVGDAVAALAALPAGDAREDLERIARYVVERDF